MCQKAVLSVAAATCCVELFEVLAAHEEFWKNPPTIDEVLISAMNFEIERDFWKKDTCRRGWSEVVQLYLDDGRFRAKRNGAMSFFAAGMINPCRQHEVLSLILKKGCFYPVVPPHREEDSDFEMSEDDDLDSDEDGDGDDGDGEDDEEDD
ncbi:hypothetical protein HDU97_004945 [Phlyctochytrium planicorne]|nr:hypothetical protein HDU97_004945 [Phlyctochytrium planicorne]